MKILRIVLYVAALLAAYAWLASPDNVGVEAIFFDVGQGDAWLMKTKAGKIILVDGGPDWKLIPLIDSYLGPERRTIDILVATHAHSDHLSSLPEITQRYEVRTAILPVSFSGGEAESLVSALKMEGADIVHLEGYRCLELEEDCSLCLDAGEQKDTEDENDNSLISRWDCGGISIVGTGDAGIGRETNYLKQAGGERADVLKVGHHGSDTSSSKEFLAAVQPKIAYISVGKDNSYGHPSLETLAKLGDIFIEIWRSDEMGSLRIYANNNKIIAEKWP
ncbi:MAG: ComEC/Rec2 family competence protein [Bacillota bacterium]